MDKQESKPDAKKCSHGVASCAKLCCSADCKSPAFVSLACEECMKLHDHAGTMNLRNWDVVASEVEAALNKKPSSTKIEQIGERADMVMTLLASTCTQLPKDIEQITYGAHSKEEMDRLRTKLVQQSGQMTGANVSALLKGARTIESNSSSIIGKTKKLAAAYTKLLDGVEQLVEEFVASRKNITEVEVEKPASKAQEGRRVSKVLDEESMNDISRVISSKVIDSKGLPSEAGSFFTPISQILPSLQHFNFVAKVTASFTQVISLNQTICGNRLYLRCVLGDASGIVTGSFFANDLLKVDRVLEFHDVRAYVQKGYIVLNCNRANTIFPSELSIPRINTFVNVSGSKWEEGTY